MTKRNNFKDNGFILSTIDDLVPENHLVRQIESSIDWNFIYPLVENLYSNQGRKSIDPVVLFKMIFIDKMFGINSMRKTCEEIKVNLAYRWFLGLSIYDDVPNYSTWSQNYIRRYNDSDVFDKIFETIIDKALEYKFIDETTIFGDSTHQKADANKRKSHNETVDIIKKSYEKDLLDEINEVRKAHNQKAIKKLDCEEIIFDENTGEEKIIRKKKDIKVSDTDNECGNFHKGEHEECFAYSHQTFCDINGFVLGFNTVPSNVHDSVSFFDVYNDLIKNHKGIKNVCLDAGYKTPAIIKTIMDNNHTPYLPYKKSPSSAGKIKRKEFIYDEDNDNYICPNGMTLEYSTVNNGGYKIYKCKEYHCTDCPLKSKCTKSKCKSISRHVWEEYKEKAEDIRLGDDKWKEIYPMRKQTIERVFADDKENHCLRFTRLRGLDKNRHNAAIIFSCHNLKKISLWRWKNPSNRIYRKGNTGNISSYSIIFIKKTIIT